MPITYTLPWRKKKATGNIHQHITKAPQSQQQFRASNICSKNIIQPLSCTLKWENKVVYTTCCVKSASHIVLPVRTIWRKLSNFSFLSEQADSKNGCQSKRFSWMMKLNKTQSSTHTLQWDTPFCPAGLWSENQARKWQSVALKRSFLYLTNYFSDRKSMTKYPFSHNSIHLRVNSDQTIPGKRFKWNQTGDKERSL